MGTRQKMTLDQVAIAKFLTWIAHTPRKVSEITERFGWSSSDITFLSQQLLEEGCILSQEGDLWALTDSKGMGGFTLFWRCQVPLLYVPSCESTNTVAAQILHEGMPVQLIVSDFQTKGRGRLGRVWNANNAENLLFSLLLQPDVPIDQMARCTLLWGAEIADELGLHVKWPNDIVDSAGRKVGGILTELLNVGTPNQRVVFGFGLNVNQLEFPDDFVTSSIKHHQTTIPQEICRVRNEKHSKRSIFRCAHFQFDDR